MASNKIYIPKKLLYFLFMLPYVQRLRNLLVTVDKHEDFLIWQVAKLQLTSHMWLFDF